MKFNILIALLVLSACQTSNTITHNVGHIPLHGRDNLNTRVFRTQDCNTGGLSGRLHVCSWMAEDGISAHVHYRF